MTGAKRKTVPMTKAALGIMTMASLAFGGCVVLNPEAFSAAFQTARFRVYAEKDSEAARSAASWADELLGRLEEALGTSQAGSDPVLYLFSSLKSFRDHLSCRCKDVDGAFLPGDPPQFLLPLEGCAMSVRETLAHELAHWYLVGLGTRAEEWLVEASCEFLESRLGDDGSDHGQEHAVEWLDMLRADGTVTFGERRSANPVVNAWFVAYALERLRGNNLREGLVALLSASKQDLESLNTCYVQARDQPEQREALRKYWAGNIMGRSGVTPRRNP